MPESDECLRQKHQFLNYWGKAVWETSMANNMAKEQSQNGRGKYQINEKVAKVELL